jgi:polyisoprenyl-teichoic acid--peptidoglycan teichoic acid transferase
MREARQTRSARAVVLRKDVMVPPYNGSPSREMPRPLLSGLLSVVLPGAGQVYAGRVLRGLVIATLALAAVALAAWYVVPRGAALADEVVNLDVLLGLFVANAVVLLGRLWVVVDAYSLAARERRSALGRPHAAVAAVSLLVLSALTVVPHALVGWGTYLTYDTIDTVFAEEEPHDVLTPSALNALPFLVPGSGQALHGDRTIAPPEPESRAWTTVLLIGGDAGYLRVGLRADTIVAVSIQANTGRAAVFSIPRNLRHAPLVGPAAAVHDRFPDILNALYRFAQARPELFPGGRDPGATALKQTVSNLLGIPVHYYVLVDLRGFVEVVDALGGIRMIAPDSVDDLTSPAFPGEPWTDIQVTQGEVVKLDGRRALAYARSRSATSDYTRMVRQRCVLAAMAGRIDSLRAVRSLARLSDAAKEFVSTDIPRQRLPDLVKLLRGIDPSRTFSVSFTPPAYSVVEPDILAYRGTAQQLLHQKAARLRDSGLRPVSGLCPGIA